MQTCLLACFTHAIGNCWSKRLQYKLHNKYQQNHWNCTLYSGGINLEVKQYSMCKAWLREENKCWIDIAFRHSHCRLINTTNILECLRHWLICIVKITGNVWIHKVMYRTSNDPLSQSRIYLLVRTSIHKILSYTIFPEIFLRILFLQLALNCENFGTWENLNHVEVIAACNNEK